MSWIIFDATGTRVPRKPHIYIQNASEGWSSPSHLFGFEDGRWFVPTWFAARMAKGWRVFKIHDGGEWIDLTPDQVAHLWQSASPDHKRLPHIAAVEMWVRTQS